MKLILNKIKKIISLLIGREDYTFVSIDKDELGKFDKIDNCLLFHKNDEKIHLTYVSEDVALNYYLEHFIYSSLEDNFRLLDNKKPTQILIHIKQCLRDDYKFGYYDYSKSKELFWLIDVDRYDLITFGNIAHSFDKINNYHFIRNEKIDNEIKKLIRNQKLKFIENGE